MILNATHAGEHYKWIEKANHVGLVRVSDSRLLWAGNPGESVPCNIVPEAVLLDFSIQRRAYLT